MSHKMPNPILQADVRNFTIGHLTFQFEEGAYKYGDLYPVSTWLFHTRLPDFQRPLVWTEDQKIRFIESAWLGLHLGTYVINRIEWRGDVPPPLDLLLIDGQQRLDAIRCYLRGDFPVFGFRWGELDASEQRRFESRAFSCAFVKINDESKLRDLYDRLNFGGTAHTEDQRASR